MSIPEQTREEINVVLRLCRELFVGKLHDYGASWRIMRPSSLTDQILIKVLRIRTLQRTGYSAVGEGVLSEFIGIINYGIIALIQTQYEVADEPDMSAEEALELYDQCWGHTLDLLKVKNQDYSEAWRSMRVSSITDLILSKVYRTKQIEDLEGQTLVSEGVEANYMDMVNYAVFALILMREDELA